MYVQHLFIGSLSGAWEKLFFRDGKRNRKIVLLNDRQLQEPEIEAAGCKFFCIRFLTFLSARVTYRTT